MLDLLRRHRPELSREDQEFAAFVIVYAAEPVMHAAVVERPPHPGNGTLAGEPTAVVLGHPPS